MPFKSYQKTEYRKSRSPHYCKQNRTCKQHRTGNCQKNKRQIQHTQGGGKYLLIGGLHRIHRSDRTACRHNGKAEYIKCPIRTVAHTHGANGNQNCRQNKKRFFQNFYLHKKSRRHPRRQGILGVSRYGICP